MLRVVSLCLRRNEKSITCWDSTLCQKVAMSMSQQSSKKPDLHPWRSLCRPRNELAHNQGPSDCLVDRTSASIFRAHAWRPSGLVGNRLPITCRPTCARVVHALHSTSGESAFMWRHFRNATTDKRRLSSWSGWFGGRIRIAGNESRSKGNGRGLKYKPGFSGDVGREARGDEVGECAGPDIGIGVEKSLRRFEGRTSTSRPGRIWSAAMSERVDESASSRN